MQVDKIIDDLRQQLQRHLQDNGLKPSQFAQQHGFPVPVITRFLSKARHRPGLHLITYLRLKEILQHNDL